MAIAGAVVTPLATLESGLALGDRLKAFRGVLEFIRGLGIDQRELLELAKMAVDLVRAPSLDDVWLFVEALLKAMESKGPAPAGTPGGLTASAVDWAAVFTFIKLLLELFGRFGVIEKRVAWVGTIAAGDSH